jgi:hypothetical protein
MTELLHCDILNVGGRQYRVLARSHHGERSRVINQQRDLQAVEPDNQDWRSGGGGGGAAVATSEDEDFDELSVPISQEGNTWIARLRLDSEVCLT